MLQMEVNGKLHEVKLWNFPANEVGVKIANIEGFVSNIVLTLLMPTSDEIIALFNILDILHDIGVEREKISVYMPYVPYGRQDRACHAGESNALRVFGRMVKAFPHFNALYVEDIHSDATYFAFRDYGISVCQMSQASCAKYLPKFDALIAPDDGASGKVITHYQVSFGTPVFTLSKERKDGKVIYTDYAFNTITGEVCVVDDICDGGATFLSLAEMLKRTQPEITSLNLYVTHGIFSKGTEELKKYYDTIFVRNNMNPSVADSVTII
jgi:ribose-phosphate pyrophosphokinase